MIWFAVWIVAFGLAFRYNRTAEKWNKVPYTMVLLIGAFLVTMANCVSMLAGSSTANAPDKLNIRSLADGTNTHGSFFLGSGYLDEEAVYFYYAEVGPKQYRQYSVPADRVVVEESTDAKPHVEITSYEQHTYSIISVFPDFKRSARHDTYKFVVPDGTILPNYVLDTSAK